MAPVMSDAAVDPPNADHRLRLGRLRDTSAVAMQARRVAAARAARPGPRPDPSGVPSATTTSSPCVLRVRATQGRRRAAGSGGRRRRRGAGGPSARASRAGARGSRSRRSQRGARPPAGGRRAARGCRPRGHPGRAWRRACAARAPPLHSGACEARPRRPAVRSPTRRAGPGRQSRLSPSPARRPARGTEATGSTGLGGLRDPRRGARAGAWFVSLTAARSGRGRTGSADLGSSTDTSTFDRVWLGRRLARLAAAVQRPAQDFG